MVGNACLLACNSPAARSLSLAGSCRGYQTALRLQGRALASSLPFRRCGQSGDAPCEPAREGGRPSVERECQASAATHDTPPARGHDAPRPQVEFIGVEYAPAWSAAFARLTSLWTVPRWGYPSPPVCYVLEVCRPLRFLRTCIADQLRELLSWSSLQVAFAGFHRSGQLARRSSAYIPRADPSPSVPLSPLPSPPHRP